MKDDEEINLVAFEKSYREYWNERTLDTVEEFIKYKFPGIKNLEVSLNQVKYDDDRYSLEEVTEFLMSLYKPKDEKSH